MKANLTSILKETRCNERVSTVTNPRFDIKDTQNSQPSGSKGVKTTGVHASNNVNIESDEDDHPLRAASDMSELKIPVERFCQNRLNLDETIVSVEDSKGEDYHRGFGFSWPT